MALVGINSITINAIDMASPRRFEPLCLFHTDKKTRNLVKLYCLYKLFFRAYSLILWREIVPNTPPQTLLSIQPYLPQIQSWPPASHAPRKQS